ncbi:MAG: 50S ribosomal protein L25 [Chloroflexi bacterium]|nr:50S ribosomal protein L25 [Chloroflexota bacterium]MCY3937347.1 50S ribosomal protein L25 [Chloroflexota bacterium]
MAARPAVMVQGRDLFGKKVGRLRSQGIVPVNLVIPGDDSQALQTDERDLVGVLRETGQSGLVELNSRDATEVALIGDVQVHPVTRRVLHVAFRRIDLTKPIQVAVPIDYVGVAPASAASDRFVAHELQELEVRCLPDDLPRSIEVDVSGLDLAGDVVRIASVASPEGVEILNDPDEVVVRVEFERAEEEETEAEDEFGLVGGIGEIGETAGDGEAEAAPPS